MSILIRAGQLATRFCVHNFLDLTGFTYRHHRKIILIINDFAQKSGLENLSDLVSAKNLDLLILDVIKKHPLTQVRGMINAGWGNSEIL
jgi:hypothetical protein